MRAVIPRWLRILQYRPSVEDRALVSEHKHPAAFGVDRSLLHEGPQRAQASLTAAELGGVLFGETARQDQALGVCRDGLIGQGAPAEHGHAHVLQQFTGFLVAEVKGGITGQSHRQGLALLHGDACQGMRPGAGRLQQGDQAFQVQVLAGQSGPGLASLLGGLQFMGRACEPPGERRPKGLTLLLCPMPYSTYW